MSTQFESFVGIISLANKEISRIKGQEMGRMGLKGSDTMCLYYLKKHPEGITSAELARLIGVDRAAVSRILAHLGERGLVRRGGRRGAEAIACQSFSLRGACLRCASPMASLTVS